MRVLMLCFLSVGVSLGRAQTPVPPLAEVQAQLETQLRLEPSQHLTVAATEVSPDGTQLVFAALDDDDSSPARVMVLERVVHDGQAEYRRVDQRPDMPGLQLLELRDEEGRALSRPTDMQAEQREDGTVWLTVTCAPPATAAGRSPNARVAHVLVEAPSR